MKPIPHLHVKYPLLSHVQIKKFTVRSQIKLYKKLYTKSANRS